MKNKILTIVFTFVVMVMIAARAQEAATPREKPAEPATTEPKKDAAAPEPGNEHEAKAKGKEEGGEDAEAALKESAMVKKFGGWLGLSPTNAYWVFVWLNFLVMAGLIGKLMKSKLPGMFRERTSAIQKGLDDARRASEAAQARLGDIESRLVKMDSEIAEMRTSAEANAKAEDERIRAATEEEKKKIVESAENEIEAATAAARRELQLHAAGLAIALAEKKIAVSEAADKALVKEFTSSLDGGKGWRN